MLGILLYKILSSQRMRCSIRHLNTTPGILATASRRHEDGILYESVVKFPLRKFVSIATTMGVRQALLVSVFHLDEGHKVVRKVLALQKGWIYRGEFIINWDPKALYSPSDRLVFTR